MLSLRKDDVIGVGWRHCGSEKSSEAAKRMDVVSWSDVLRERFNKGRRSNTERARTEDCLWKIPDKVVLAHAFTLHTHQEVASTWLVDHQGRPSAPTISLDELRMARYRVLQYIHYKNKIVKGDPYIILVIKSNHTTVPHRLRYNQVLPLTGNDVIMFC